MRAWQAIIFDLDDTLYAERQFVASGMRAVAVWAETTFGWPADEGFAELRQLFDSGVRGDTFDRWLQSHDVHPAEWTPTMVEVYRGHTPQITPYPGVPELLARLRRHCRLGLVTDGYLAVQQRKLTALGLAEHFDAIVYSDELGREAWKPSPLPFRRVLGQLGVPSDTAVYVADNPAKDFLGARRAGMSTIRVRRADGIYAHLEPPTPAHAPDAEIGELSVEAIADGRVGRAERAPPATPADFHRPSQPADHGGARSARPTLQTRPTLQAEQPVCNICGGAAARRLYSETYRLADEEIKLGIAQCERCGLVYTSPRLTAESIAAVYRLDAARTISHDYCWSGQTDDARFTKLLGRLATLAPSGRLLDVGCGTGQFLAEARRTNRWELLGVEPSTDAADEARRAAGCTIHATTLEAAPLAPGEFDIVTLLGVLEHLPDPLGTLHRVRRLLKPGGVLAVYVPNFHYLRLKDTGPIALVRRGRWSDLHPQEHLYQFTPHSLGQLLAAAQFEVRTLDLGYPFLQGGPLRRGVKRAAYAAARLLQRTTGLHLGGLEAVAQTTTHDVRRIHKSAKRSFAETGSQAGAWQPGIETTPTTEAMSWTTMP